MLRKITNAVGCAEQREAHRSRLMRLVPRTSYIWHILRVEYYNVDIHKGALAQPEFVKRALSM